ncbi:MAG: hypothetical protein J5793_04495, partial [Clostridia bacterium]|nr:hypothetical protein [Clostridia bacterium]
RIKVYFPLVESGFGHIMPAGSVEQTFRKKYGDRVEVISSRFFADSGDKHMIKYEKMMSSQVKLYNRFPVIGYIANYAGELFGRTLTSFAVMRMSAPVASRSSMKLMKELAPDVIVSTHWSTNYYAEHLENKPLTVMYCPDAQMNALFRYRSDLYMISMPGGYRKALARREFNENNLKLVPFLIRNQAFSVCGDKKELRRTLGIPEDNFTVVMAEGGYGIGKMEKISRLLIKEHVPMTVIPVCGTNKKLYERLSALTPTEEVVFLPQPFTERILDLEAAADVFCGKSGNILAESTFFGNPSIVTNCTTPIEKHIAEHYIGAVGCSFKQFSPRKTAKILTALAEDDSPLDGYRAAAKAYRGHFGSEAAADAIWEAIKKKHPGLE